MIKPRFQVKQSKNNLFHSVTLKPLMGPTAFARKQSNNGGPPSFKNTKKVKFVQNRKDLKKSNTYSEVR